MRWLFHGGEAGEPCEYDGVGFVSDRGGGVEDAAHGCLEEIVVETVNIQYAAFAILYNLRSYGKLRAE